MRMHDFDAVLISGASGVLGSFAVRELLREFSCPIYCLLRSPMSFTKLTNSLGKMAISRIRPLFADLTSCAEMEALAGSLNSKRLLGIHCAADVSWTRSEVLLRPVNEAGTRRFAELLLAASQQVPTLCFLSTAYVEAGQQPRNAYELTKGAAEAMLTKEYGARLALYILKCSLVVGSSEDGWIGRFNGLYPLVRIVAHADVPCLIAEPGYCLDTVPIDFVWREICAGAALARPSAPIYATAAAGNSAISLIELAHGIQRETNMVRRANGLSSLPEISIIPERKFKFLMTAAKTWGLESRFAKVEQISQLMSGYLLHAATARRIEPTSLTGQPPDPRNYLAGCIRYWLEQNIGSVLRDRSPEWIGGKLGAADL
jgi:thioester reductase-like protein